MTEHALHDPFMQERLRRNLLFSDLVGPIGMDSAPVRQKAVAAIQENMRHREQVRLAAYNNPGEPRPPVSPTGAPEVSGGSPANVHYLGEGLHQLARGAYSEVLFGEPLELLLDLEKISSSYQGFRDPKYDWKNDPQLEGFEPYWEFFAASGSFEESTAIAGRMGTFLQQRADLYTPLSDVGRFMGVMLDPTWALLAGPGKLIRMGTRGAAIASGGSALEAARAGAALSAREVTMSRAYTAAWDARVRNSGIGASAAWWGIAGVPMEIAITAPNPGAESDALVTLAGGAVFGGAFRAVEKLSSAMGLVARHDDILRDYAQGVRRYEQAYGLDRGIRPQAVSTTESWGQSRALTRFVDRPSLSAETLPSARTVQEVLDGEALVAAMGLERHPFSPITRVLKGSSLYARELVTQLLEIPFLQNKNLLSVPTRLPAWRDVVKWRSRALDTTLQQRSLYKEYFARMTEEGVPDQPLTRAQFEAEIFYARINGNQHAIPEVAQAAKLWGDNLFGPMGEKADASGIFVRMHEMDLEYYESVGAGKVNKDGTYTVIIDGERFFLTPSELATRIEDTQRIIQRINETGGLRKNYVPIHLKRDIILRNPKEVKPLLQKVFGLSAKEAHEWWQRMSRQDPFHSFGPDVTGMSSSIRARDMFWDDATLKKFIDEGGDKFLETDISKLGLHYARSVGADLALFERFGSVDMRHQIVNIRQDYADLMEGLSGNARRRLRAERDKVIKDVRAMRDLLRGTYGLPADPNRPFSVFARNVKRLNALSLLTGALAALPDPGRIVMRDGFTRTFGTIAKAFDGQMGKTVRNMAQDDLRLAGQGFEMLAGMRASMMADLGDAFGIGGAVERGLEKLNNFTFTYVNGMNLWTDLMKQGAGMVIQTRMIEDISNIAARIRAYREERGVGFGSGSGHFAQFDELLEEAPLLGSAMKQTSEEFNSRYTLRSHEEGVEGFNFSELGTKTEDFHVESFLGGNKPILYDQTIDSLARVVAKAPDEDAARAWFAENAERYTFYIHDNDMTSLTAIGSYEELGDAIKRYGGQYSRWTAVRKGEEWRVSALDDLVRLRDAHAGSAEGIALNEFHTLMGRLLGYPEKDIVRFIGGDAPIIRKGEHPPLVFDEGSPERAARARLAASYMDDDMILRMDEQLAAHSQRNKDLRTANMGAWSDQGAADVYASALGREVDISVITPGLGDTPLFMSSELGGLIFQFKKFSAAAFQRIAVAGLQEPNMRFMTGAVMMVGLGLIIARIRAEQVGSDWEDRSFLQKMSEAIDRSGVLGIFGDAIHGAAALTDPQFSDQRVVSTVLGPTGGQAMRFTDAVYGLADGDLSNQDKANIRGVMPWGNIAHLHNMNKVIYGQDGQ